LFRLSPLLILWLLGLGFSVAARAESPVRLEDMDWDEAQQAGLSRLAQKIATNPEAPWKHGQTEHFCFHYTQRKSAERAAAEAEAYYALIKKDLKIDEDRWEVKAHIFLFETGTAWVQFLVQAGVDRWSAGFYRSNELFLPSPSGITLDFGQTMPHELTHMVLHRFVRGVLPIWLNEGVAEEQARKHYYNRTTTKGSKIMVAPSLVSAENYLPLAILTVATDYPADEAKVRPFYFEALRLVQFLLEEHPNGNFLEFLQLTADGAKFETALTRVYTGYYNLESFEKKFKKIAVYQTK
jgi:hypothetical protein